MVGSARADLKRGSLLVQVAEASFVIVDKVAVELCRAGAPTDDE